MVVKSNEVKERPEGLPFVAEIHATKPDPLIEILNALEFSFQLLQLLLLLFSRSLSASYDTLFSGIKFIWHVVEILFNFRLLFLEGQQDVFLAFIWVVLKLFGSQLLDILMNHLILFVPNRNLLCNVNRHAEKEQVRDKLDVVLNLKLVVIIS